MVKNNLNELIQKQKILEEKKKEIMDDCAKKGLPYSEFMELAKDVSRELYLITQDIRLNQSPTMEYGKTWRGDMYTIEEFIDYCKDNYFTDDDGIGYYATNNAKSDIIAYPSDFKNNIYRTDFTHIIWFNK